jgi:hypothetical protein
MRRFNEKYGYKYEIADRIQTKTMQAYADDLLLFSNSKENMNRLMDGIVTYMEYVHIAINPNQYKILSSNME